MTYPVHGGDLHQIKQTYPDTPLPWVDLSTGINPIPYPWQEKIPADILKEAANRLPGKADFDNCRTAYARYLGCNSENIFLGAGSQAIIEKLPQLFLTSEVYILGPTYREHEYSWDRMGHQIRYLPYGHESLSHIPEGKIVIITSPNNPDGQFIDRDILYKFTCDYCRDKGKVIIDEAFMDLTPQNSLIQYDLPPQAFVLRSLGKFFGLGGLRVGALYATPSFGKRLTGLSALWNISTLSLIISTNVLQDDQWIIENRQRLHHNMKRMTDMITSAGFRIIGKTDLYCLIQGDNMNSLFHHLAQQGIFSRTFSNDPHQLRLGLPSTDEAFTRLSKIFQEFSQ